MPSLWSSLIELDAQIIGGQHDRSQGQKQGVILWLTSAVADFSPASTVSPPRRYITRFRAYRPRHFHRPHIPFTSSLFIMYIPALAAVGTFVAAATSILYDGRAPSNLTAAQLDTSSGPYVTYVLCFCDENVSVDVGVFNSSAVKGSQNASHVRAFLHVVSCRLWF